MTRYWIGFTAITSCASISSFTRMAPSSAAMEVPAWAAIMIEVIVGESSRTMITTTMLLMSFSTPSGRRMFRDWMARIIPIGATVQTTGTMQVLATW